MYLNFSKPFDKQILYSGVYINDNSLQTKSSIMKAKEIICFLGIVFLAGCSTSETRQKPPLAQVSPVEDVYFGTKISDPYRYMENLKDSTVQQWFKAQADYSRKILNSIPGRQKLIDKMMEFDGRRS